MKKKNKEILISSSFILILSYFLIPFNFLNLCFFKINRTISFCRPSRIKASSPIWSRSLFSFIKDRFQELSFPHLQYSRNIIIWKVTFILFRRIKIVHARNMFYILAAWGSNDFSFHFIYELLCSLFLFFS